MAARALRRRRRADSPETMKISEFSTKWEALQLFAILEDLAARRGVCLCTSFQITQPPANTHPPARRQ